ncbi:MAG TPA: riboflavin synthase [Woeseiaceae bacterium]
MFTGIVKAIGVIDERRAGQGGALRLAVSAPALPWQELSDGDSIAVNGVCLTVAGRREHGFVADVSAETCTVTTLGELREHGRVNLEPALAVGERLGGHLVAGHVDCVGTVAQYEAAGTSRRMVVEVPQQYRRYLAKKGSVCVDGISLTINEVSGNAFEVNIIPHTAEHTTAGGYAPGARVNIEVDLIARYLESLLGGVLANDSTQDHRNSHGHA